MAAVVKVNEGIAIGIGAQTNQATVNADVQGATDLITTVAGTPALTATGIFLRSPEDLSKAFERIESDGGTFPGSLTRASGVLSRVEPTVSFTIDAMGNRLVGGTPTTGEFTFSEYFEQILEGARLVRGTEAVDNTPYNFAVDTSAGSGYQGVGSAYKTIKIWRGTSGVPAGVSESWTLIGCTFNLTWNYTAGEKATIDVEVIADAVEYNPADTFPPAILSVAYGNQVFAAPLLERAVSSIDFGGGVDERPWQTGSLSIAYDVNEELDCNVVTGVIKSQGTRTVAFEAGFFRSNVALQDDFTFLERSVLPLPALDFQLGQDGTDLLINSQQFTLPEWRVTNTDKIDGDRVLRTISGYATASAVDAEFELRAV